MKDALGIACTKLNGAKAITGDSVGWASQEEFILTQCLKTNN